MPLKILVTEEREINTINYCLLSILVLAAGVSRRANATNSASLSGYLANYSAYFLERERLRHHRYELGLKQKAKINFQLSTYIEGRARFDAALMPESYAPGQGMASEVRADEMAEADLRQAYLSYIGEYVSWTAGTQLIDWVESLSSLIASDLTPYDIRHARFGDGSEIIVPVTGVKANLDLDFLSIEGLIVPFPSYSRAPKGDNGYGYGEALSEEASNYAIEMENRGNEHSIKHSEAGLRILGSIESFEWTLLAYRGHHKSPIIELVQDNRQRTARLTLTNPRLNTFGLFSSYAGESFVLRANAIYQPRRRPQVVEIFDDLENDYYEDITRVGLGYDMVFNRHFKFYTEAYLIRTDREGAIDFLDPKLLGIEDEYVSVLRVTNESFDDVEFRLDYVHFTPKKGYLFNPAVLATVFESFKLEAGARLVSADHDEAPTKIIENASHIYANLRWYFAADDAGD